MKHFLGAAVLAAFFLSRAGAQTEAKAPELPAAAGSEAPAPSLPGARPTFDPQVDSGAARPETIPQKTMTKEEENRLKQDENWLVEGMQKKQEDNAAAAELAKKNAELKTKKENSAKESTSQPGEISNFKPVVSDNSLASLNPNPSTSNSAAGKKKTNNQDLSPLQDKPSASNPLTTSSSALVHPILGPSRQGMNENVASLNPGVGTAPLPATGIKKLSSNPNFIPEGYADSWTKQQEGSPYAPTVQPQVKPIVPAAPLTPRPTFKDLANTIPDPTQVR